MDPSISFESVSPEADGESDLQKGYDFGIIPKVLAVGMLREAETVFARCAKKKLRTDLGRQVGMMLSKDMVLPRMTFHATGSLTLELPSDAGEALNNELAGELYKLVGRLSQHILETREEKGESAKALLIDAMTCQILEISPRFFSFRLGQKWGVA
jgi:hypothetical protein